MLYTTLKYLHILLAIVAVGFNASYVILLRRASKEPEHELHVLRTVKFLDDRFANPAYGLLLLTGIGMVLVSQALTFTTLWILVGLIIYAGLVALGVAAYSPTLRRQIEILERDGASSPDYQRLAARARVMGFGFAAGLLTVIAMMVFKPTL